MVVGIEREGDMHVVRGCRSFALSPADVPEHRQQRCRMGRGRHGQQLARQLFGTVDPDPVRDFVRDAKEGGSHGFVDARHIGQDLVS